MAVLFDSEGRGVWGGVEWWNEMDHGCVTGVWLRPKVGG